MQWCNVAIGNLLGIKPIIYAILRATSCDNNSAAIGNLFLKDFFEDGVLGCTIAIVNVFSTPDYTSVLDFITNFLLPQVLGKQRHTTAPQFLLMFIFIFYVIQ